MAIKSSLLALLSEGESYGYELKRVFEERTGGTWPVNIGQVYSTLTRLERDGLVFTVGEDASGHVVYAVTQEGRVAASAWLAEPVLTERAPRDELAIKVAIAMRSPEADVEALMLIQRAASLEHMQELTRMKNTDADPAWLLMMERSLFEVEAEIRWLDHCESRVAAARKDVGTPRSRRSGERRMAEMEMGDGR
ncbi:MAG: helix-turn-helix transcriptional regulator [Candidatus Nanopelagicales bacterium]|nr:helix-turn-helix transcriptional regulator [Candidatus Nanopelagicales bacterium]